MKNITSRHDWIILKVGLAKKKELKKKPKNKQKTNQKKKKLTDNQFH